MELEYPNKNRPVVAHLPRTRRGESKSLIRVFESLIRGRLSFGQSSGNPSTSSGCLHFGRRAELVEALLRQFITKPDYRSRISHPRMELEYSNKNRPVVAHLSRMRRSESKSLIRVFESLIRGRLSFGYPSTILRLSFDKLRMPVTPGALSLSKREACRSASASEILRQAQDACHPRRAELVEAPPRKSFDKLRMLRFLIPEQPPTALPPLADARPNPPPRSSRLSRG